MIKNTLLLLLLVMLASCAKNPNLKLTFQVDIKEALYQLGGPESRTDSAFSAAFMLTDRLTSTDDTLDYVEYFVYSLNVVKAKKVRYYFPQAGLLDSDDNAVIIKILQERIDAMMDHIRLDIEDRLLRSKIADAMIIEHRKKVGEIVVRCYTEDAESVQALLRSQGDFYMSAIEPQASIILLDKVMEVSSEKGDSAARKLLGLGQVKSGGVLYSIDDTAAINSILAKTDSRKFLLRNHECVWTKAARYGDAQLCELLVLSPRKSRKSIDGEAVNNAYNYQSQDTQSFVVEITMNPAGATEWRRLTKELADMSPEKGRIAVMYDGVCLSAPTVVSEIPAGRSTISGNLSEAECNNIAIVLNSGKYPVPLQITKVEAIGEQ